MGAPAPTPRSARPKVILLEDERLSRMKVIDDVTPYVTAQSPENMSEKIILFPAAKPAGLIEPKIKK